RAAALHLRDEVRLGYRLAVVLHHHPGRIRDEEGLLPHLSAHRIPLHPLRRPPRPPVRRRPAADRAALLQQRRRAEIHSEGLEDLAPRFRSSSSGGPGKWKRTGPSGSAFTNCRRYGLLELRISSALPRPSTTPSQIT